MTPTEKELATMVKHMAHYAQSLERECGRLGNKAICSQRNETITRALNRVTEIEATA